MILIMQYFNKVLKVAITKKNLEIVNILKSIPVKIISEENEILLFIFLIKLKLNNIYNFNLLI